MTVAGVLLFLLEHCISALLGLIGATHPHAARAARTARTARTLHTPSQLVVRWLGSRGSALTWRCLCFGGRRSRGAGRDLPLSAASRWPLHRLLPSILQRRWRWRARALGRHRKPAREAAGAEGGHLHGRCGDAGRDSQAHKGAPPALTHSPFGCTQQRTRTQDDEIELEAPHSPPTALLSSATWWLTGWARIAGSF
jgi:hypothetical protein